MHRNPNDERETATTRTAGDIGLIAAWSQYSYHERVILIAGSLYVFSFFLPTVEFSKGADWGWGIQAFQMGWCAIFDNDGKWESIGLAVAWFLNPAMWIGVVLLVFRQGKLAGSAGGLGVVLGLLALPGCWPFLVALPGYWIWLASAASLLALGWYPSLRQ